MEFAGPGIASLPIDFRNGIDVMTTETTCLSSIWETDEKGRAWYETHLRPTYYSGETGRVGHEMILDLTSFKKDYNIDCGDIDHRLMDYGFHAPTLSFPVHELSLIHIFRSVGSSALLGLLGSDFGTLRLLVRTPVSYTHLGGCAGNLRQGQFEHFQPPHQRGYQ